MFHPIATRNTKQIVNVERAQALQEELAQRRASLHHDFAEALQGQAALLANIIEEEMAHQTQISALSQLHIQQAEEIKSQSDDIRHLSTLLEKQQAILEKVQEQQRRMPQIPVTPMNRIEELQREAFNILPGMVNARRGVAVAHASGISQDIPVTGRLILKMNWPRKPHGMHINSCNMCTLLPTLRGDLHLLP